MKEKALKFIDRIFVEQITNIADYGTRENPTQFEYNIAQQGRTRVMTAVHMAVSMGILETAEADEIMKCVYMED